MSSVSEHTNSLKSTKGNVSMMKEPLKKLFGATQGTNESDHSFVIKLLVEYLENTVLSEDKPEGVVKTVLEEIQENSLQQIDPATIAENIIKDVASSINEKIGLAEESVNEILIDTLPKLKTSVLEFAKDDANYLSLEEEVKYKLETLVKTTLNESKAPVTEERREKVQTFKGSTSRLIEAEEEEILTECTMYLDVNTISTKIIDNTVKAATKFIEDRSQDFWLRNLKIKEEHDVDEQTSSEEDDNFPFVEIFERIPESIKWPSIKEFTRELGKSKLYEFMYTWSYSEEWLYCINHLGGQSDDCNDYYLYEAIWSIPTISYPIPQATASVFFTIEVSRVIPPVCQVVVTYRFEGSRFVHTPEMLKFQEDWLFNIIDAKINLFKTITF